jgi:hypothetical protein
LVEVVTEAEAARLDFAARPGRIREAALALLGQVRKRPQAAAFLLAEGLREARQLHSRERNLVGDGVRGVLQHEALLDHLLGGADDEARWLGWLVGRGLPVVAAQSVRMNLSFESVIDLERGGLAAVVGRSATEAVSLLGSFRPEIAAELVRSLGEEGALAFVRASARRSAGLRSSAARATDCIGARAVAMKIVARVSVMDTVVARSFRRARSYCLSG